MTIHDTFKEAQDILARLDWSRYEQGCRDAFRDQGGPRPVQMDQSLGEPCLEINSDEIRTIQTWRERSPSPYLGIQLAHRVYDAPPLRQAMYHRH